MNDDIEPKKKTEDRPAYMREYMKKKYKENPEFWRHYKNTLRTKKVHNLSNEEVAMFKDNLATYASIKKIREGLTSQEWDKIVGGLSLFVLGNDSISVSNPVSDLNGTPL